MNATTTIGRNSRGELAALTRVALNDSGRELRIETSKSTRGLWTHASVVHHEAECYSHVFGGADGDYRRTIECTPTRATAGAIRTQHERALAKADEIIAEALAHYAQRDAVKEATA